MAYLLRVVGPPSRDGGLELGAVPLADLRPQLVEEVGRRLRPVRARRRVGVVPAQYAPGTRHVFSASRVCHVSQRSSISVTFACMGIPDEHIHM